MRKWNLIIIVCLIVIAFAGHARSAEPNEPNIPPLPVVPDSNLIAPGDGVVAGLFYRNATEPGQGSTLAQIGYQYGVALFYGAADVDKFNYYEAGVEFESRDIAQEDSVLVLSNLALKLFPEGYMITGVAGVGYSWYGDNTGGITIGGVNVRPNEKKQNFCIPFRVVTPFDKNPEIRAGLIFRF